jgi:hypothetical protein
VPASTSQPSTSFRSSIVPNGNFTGQILDKACGMYLAFARSPAFYLSFEILNTTHKGPTPFKKQKQGSQLAPYGQKMKTNHHFVCIPKLHQAHLFT